MSTTATPESVTLTSSSPDQHISATPGAVPTHAPTPPAQVPVSAVQPSGKGFVLPNTWPLAAQLAAAFLLGAVTVLIAIRGLSYLGTGSQPSELHHRVDLNQASHVELLQLPGVGDSMARRIENYRDQHGRFASVDELRQVNGIGQAKLEQLRPWVTVSLEAENDNSGQAELARPASSKMAANASRAVTPKAANNSKKATNLKTPIDINKASAEELQCLPRIGATLSQRIVAERSKGPFKKVDDLRRVSGIGAKTIENLRPLVTVGSDSIRVVAAEEDMPEPEEDR